MSTVHAVVTIVTILANAGIAAADLLKADFVLANSARVGVPRSWLPFLAVLKLAGAAGLLLGLLWLPALGAAAAVGLVAFYLGAVAAHVRAGVLSNIAFPGAYLALAVASLVLALAH
ncbi:DoxX family protein [Nocardiopsis aegyptia]|uniref:DoxX family protein n=1 Tax=Nocardiopsis aegyptia TaxID=220378 RepID=UPI00366EB72A